MADSLRLRNYSSLIGQSGNEMKLVSGRGGNKTHKWWGRGPVRSVDFNVSLSNGHIVVLKIACGSNCEVTIEHDGDGNFAFHRANDIERIGVFNIETGNLITDYIISKRTKKVHPVTVSALPENPKIGSVLISGLTKVSMDSPSSLYSFTTTGNATDLSPTFTVTDKKAKIKDNLITFSAAGSYTVTVSLSSESASDSPTTGTLNVTVTKATVKKAVKEAD